MDRTIALIVLLLAVLALAGVAVAFWGRRIHFSLRTLLVAVTVLALLLGGVAMWRNATLAQTEWFEPGSAEDRQWFPAATLKADGDEFLLVYRTRRRQSGTLTHALSNIELRKRTTSHTAYIARPGGVFELKTSGRELAEEALTTFDAADVVAPGQFVVRGIVVDGEGKGVPDATVDLMGSYVYVNHFQTRDDGTFVMTLEAPADGRYWLRIRDRNNRRWETRTLKLLPEQPERVVRVTVD